jgi:hypothetical protein
MLPSTGRRDPADHGERQPAPQADALAEGHANAREIRDTRLHVSVTIFSYRSKGLVVWQTYLSEDSKSTGSTLSSLSFSKTVAFQGFVELRRKLGAF